MNQHHKIIGAAHVEATQRGFVVWVKTNKRAKAQLTDASNDYTATAAIADAIDGGNWTGERKGAFFLVQGKSLYVER